MADPGYPVGGHGPIRGHMDLRCGHSLAKTNAKVKKLGPIGGHVPGTPPTSANDLYGVVTS